jgi:hypothetical protein
MWIPFESGLLVTKQNTCVRSETFNESEGLSRGYIWTVCNDLIRAVSSSGFATWCNDVAIARMWKNFSGAHDYTLHLLYLDRGTTHHYWFAARVMQYASKWDHRTSSFRDRNNARTPQITEVHVLSMQCMRDLWHWLKIRGLKRPCS